MGLTIALVTSARAAAAGAGKEGVHVVVQLISYPVGLLVMVGMLSAMLPTTFGRAILVTLCYMLVSLLVLCVPAVIAFLVFVVALQGA